MPTPFGTPGRAARALIFALAACGVLGGAPAWGQRLIEFSRSALDTNPYLRVRQLEVERARAEADGVASRLQPQIAAQAAWSRNDYRGAPGDERRYDGRRAGLTARLALVDLPTRHRLGAARQTAGQRESDAAQTRMALLAQVVGAYLDTLQAEAEIGALDGERAAVRRQVERLRAMRSRQMARITDLAETEAWARTLDTRRIDLQQQRDQASARLVELTGLPVGTLAPLQALPVEPAEDLGEAGASAPPAGAEADHPRLAALARAAAAARLAVAGARAEHLPQLALVGSHTYTDLGYDNREQAPYHASSLGLELRVPLFEGGRAGAAEREAQARLAIAAQQLEAVRREIEREIGAAQGGARASRARIGATAQEVAALQQTVRAQERGVELGASTVVDLLEARRRLLRAQADHARARHDHLRDRAALQLARGRLDVADIAHWERWFAPAAAQ